MSAGVFEVIAGEPLHTQRQLEMKEDGQEYAQVVHMLDNGRCKCYCFDGPTRIGYICDKMRKKVWVGDIVLCLLNEDGDSCDFEEDNCDIIHRYNTNEVRNLKNYGELPETVQTNETIKDYSVSEEVRQQEFVESISNYINLRLIWYHENNSYSIRWSGNIVCFRNCFQDHLPYLSNKIKWPIKDHHDGIYIE